MSTCLHTAHLAFRSATASGGNDTGPNCVEVAPFFKATRSNPSGNCVEVAFASARDSNGNGGNNCVEVGEAKDARKATASGAAGHCVTVSHAKAAASGPLDKCVEPGQATEDTHSDCTPETCLTPGINPGDIVVRDSKLGEDSPLVVWAPDAWRGYVANVVAHGMETGGPLGYLMRDPRNPGIVLNFNVGEEGAFRDGCTKGEFNYAEVAASAA